MAGIIAFIPSLLAGDYRSFYVKMGIVVLLWFIVIAASMVDLIAGIKASHRCGNYRTHSYGLRKTIAKDLQYLGILIMLLFIDIAASALGDYIGIFQVPIGSVAGVLCITIIEAVSVRENMIKGRTKAESKVDDIEDTAKLIITLCGPDKAKKALKTIEEKFDKKEL